MAQFIKYMLSFLKPLNTQNQFPFALPIPINNLNIYNNDTTYIPIYDTIIQDNNSIESDNITNLNLFILFSNLITYSKHAYSINNFYITVSLRTYISYELNKIWNYDKSLCIKLIFHKYNTVNNSNIEKVIFMECIEWLILNHNDIINEHLDNIINWGNYDILFELIKCDNIKDTIITVIIKQLSTDITIFNTFLSSDTIVSLNNIPNISNVCILLNKSNELYINEIINELGFDNKEEFIKFINPLINHIKYIDDLQIDNYWKNCLSVNVILDNISN